MAAPTINLFISAVSDEFKSFREELHKYLSRPGVRVEEQQGFIRNGFPILTELNDYVAKCDAVIHLAGDRTGSARDDGIPGPENRQALLDLLPDLPTRMQLTTGDLARLSYTQWEAVLAIYHGRRLFVAVPTDSVIADQRLDEPATRDRQIQSQRDHLQRLEQHWEKYPDFHFQSKHHLCLQVYRVCTTCCHDLK